MSPPAQHVLERLLRRGETARRRGQNASLSMRSARDAGEYLALRSLAEIETFHAHIALAERDGGIEVQRDRCGDGERLERLSVANLTALARHLGTIPLDQQADAAADALSRWQAQFPIIHDVLMRWREGRKVRGADASAASDLADAAVAVAARQADAGNERILRRESVRLFGQSKRLEKLTPWLDLLLTNDLASSGMMPQETWALLDLRREPQPFLVAGSGTVTLLDGMQLPLARPFLGLPSEAISALSSPARCVLSIENLASFHDAAALAAQRHDILLLYTAGMPSPAWRKACLRLLQGLPQSLAFYHWGDIDEGGFRIASVLAGMLGSVGRALRPWCMTPDVAIAETPPPPPPETLRAMCRWARRAGWDDVACELEISPMSLEQERLDALLPDTGDV